MVARAAAAAPPAVRGRVQGQGPSTDIDPSDVPPFRPCRARRPDTNLRPLHHAPVRTTHLAAAATVVVHRVPYHVGEAAQVHPRWAPEELRLGTPTGVVLDVPLEVCSVTADVA